MRICYWSSDVCSSDLLPPERTGPVFHFAQNIVQAGKVGFGSAEFLLGIPAADVKAGDACRLFQHHASFCGLGRNGGSNLALTYERRARSEEHTSELQSLMRISYAVFCLKKKTNNTHSIRLIIYIQDT